MKNMKKMKRLVALALSVVMVLAMSVFAFAAEQTFTITAPATTHQYEIYQIFTGDLSGSTLSNVKWGANGTKTAGSAVDEATLNALTAVNTGSNKEILAVVEKYANLKSTPIGTVTNESTYDAAAGYYLIKDKDNTVSGIDSYTTYLVKVAGNVTITPKADVPSFKKKLKDKNDTEGTTSDWQDSADYDIGDDIPFKLEGKVASNYADYKGKYYFAFHDIEEEGLSFNKNSVEVYVGENKIETGYEVVENPTDGCTFEVVFKNLKDISSVEAGSKIRVEYTSKLNDKAKLGKEGNVNKAKLEFSNNPNEEQKGEDKPGTGETPWDNVIVFTYQVVVDKYAESENGQKLPGAEFTLQKVLKDGSKETVKVVKSDDGTSFTFKGLDDGKYILTETKTPNEYNSIDPIEFTVNADHTITWESQERTDILTSLTGTATDGKITFTANTDKSELATKVVNKKGSTLPSTGGIGTTIFYVVGAILMVGAAVLLITKRRAEN